MARLKPSNHISIYDPVIYSLSNHVPSMQVGPELTLHIRIKVRISKGYCKLIISACYHAHSVEAVLRGQSSPLNTELNSIGQAVDWSPSCNLGALLTHSTRLHCIVCLPVVATVQLTGDLADQAAQACTSRFGSIAKGLARRKLKYHRSSKWPGVMLQADCS